jgi:7-keto-8-aminopelargonate synthetase-like enzyme
MEDFENASFRNYQSRLGIKLIVVDGVFSMEGDLG